MYNTTMNELALFVQASQRFHKTHFFIFCKERNLHPHAICYFQLFPSFKHRFRDLQLFESNIFMKQYAEFIWRVYNTAVKAYLLFRKCARRWRFKRLPVKNTADLMLNALSTCPAKETMVVVDKGIKYVFKYCDLLNLIHAALTHSIEMFAEPLDISNPYTGVPFSNNMLYLLWYNISNCHFQTPPLFTYLMKCNFNVTEFSTQYECLLKDVVVAQYISAYTPAQLNVEIVHMFETVKMLDKIKNTYVCVVKNANQLPSKCLAQFKPWLKLFFTYLYTLNPYLKHVSLKKLMKHMIAFKHENPLFGEYVEARIVYAVKRPIRFIQYENVHLPTFLEYIILAV